MRHTGNWVIEKPSKDWYHGHSKPSNNWENMGGWEYEKMPPCKLPRDAERAFLRATEMNVGVVYTPVLYVAKQIVNGVKYCIVCKSVNMTYSRNVGCKTLYIYEKTDGDSSIVKITDVIS